MITPLIGMKEVDGAIHNARVIMNAYLRSRINLATEIRIVLSKNAPHFEYKDGRTYTIKSLVLKKTEEHYVVIYNGDDERATALNSLSSNELYMLCSIVESFWKHRKPEEEKNGTEDVEFQTVE